MNEKHDWQATPRKGASRAGDVQVQALELVLFEGLRGDDVFGEPEQLCFIVLALGLRTDGSAERQFQNNS